MLAAIKKNDLNRLNAKISQNKQVERQHSAPIDIEEHKFEKPKPRPLESQVLDDDKFFDE